MRRTVPLVWLLMMVMAVAVWPQSYRGELTTRYRDRWGSEDYEDEDLYAYLRFSFSADEEDEIGGALSLRWDQDLLTRANEIDDGDSDLRVYYAYLDIDKLDQFDLRLGRQILDEAEGFQITGARGVYRGAQKNFRLGLFAGQPVSYYESASDEWAGGLTWSLQPTSRSRLRGSWVHVDEDLTEDDVVTASYRLSSPQGWNAWSTVRTLNFDVWNGFFGGNFLVAPIDLRVTTTYRRQEDINNSSSRYYSHLSTILGPSRPYHRLTVNLNRAFGEWFSLGGGWNRREILSGSENRGNQEYTRFFFDVFLLEKLLRGFEANVDFSRWYTERDASSTLAGSVSRRFGEKLEVAVGTHYSKYDLRRLFNRPDEIPIERYDVRTYYIEGDWRVRDQYRIQVEFERGTDAASDDPFYQLEVRLGLDLGFLGSGFSK